MQEKEASRRILRNSKRHRKRGAIQANGGKPSGPMPMTRKKQLEERLQHSAVLELHLDGCVFARSLLKTLVFPLFYVLLLILLNVLFIS